jgi:hypothetical protein
MFLTRDAFLAIDDGTIKEIEIPVSIPNWGGKKLYIKALTRGQQDSYLKRRFQATRLKQSVKGKEQEFSDLSSIYGHDAWLCVKGCCDENGKSLFTEKDIDALNNKSGEAIGWVATQIIEFSGMRDDAAVAAGEKTDEQVVAEELKN